MVREETLKRLQDRCRKKYIPKPAPTRPQKPKPEKQDNPRPEKQPRSKPEINWQKVKEWAKAR